MTADTYWAAAGAIGTDVPNTAIFTDLQGNVITGTTRIDVPNIGTSSGNQHPLPSGTAALVASDDARLTGWDGSATLSTSGVDQTVITLSPDTGKESSYVVLWQAHKNGVRTIGGAQKIEFTVYYSVGNAQVVGSQTIWTASWGGSTYSFSIFASGATVLLRVTAGGDTVENEVSYRLLKAY